MSNSTQDEKIVSKKRGAKPKPDMVTRQFRVKEKLYNRFSVLCKISGKKIHEGMEEAMINFMTSQLSENKKIEERENSFKILDVEEP